MTAELQVPEVLPDAADVGQPASDSSTRMLRTARRLLRDGLALLAVAILLAIAESLALWFGAILVAIMLLAVAAVIAAVAAIARVGIRSVRDRWS